MFSQQALEDVRSLDIVWVTESITNPTGNKRAEMERAISSPAPWPCQHQAFPWHRNATGCQWLPIPARPWGLLAPGHQGTRAPGPCQLAGKATAGRSDTVINKIIIRNKPQALAERLHCHASTAYPALGSLAWQRWGSPNHTHPGSQWTHVHGQGEASKHPEWGKSP